MVSSLRYTQSAYIDIPFLMIAEVLARMVSILLSVCQLDADTILFMLLDMFGEHVATGVDFDFDNLVLDTIARECTLEDDDAEGYPLEPITTPFCFPTPLSPIPNNSLPLVPDGYMLPPPILLKPECHPSPSRQSLTCTLLTTLPGTNSKPGSGEDAQRKLWGKTKLAMEHLQDPRCIGGWAQISFLHLTLFNSQVLVPCHK